MTQDTICDLQTQQHSLMKTIRAVLLLTLSLGGAICLCSLSRADETNSKAATAAGTGEKLVFHTDWKGERIELPPPFAPEMKLKGIEVIRFAPGMFNAQSDSFFTYAFVFSVSKDQDLTQEVIQREILAYYRGLAKAILKNKGTAADVGKFTFRLEQAKEATGTPEKVSASARVTQYTGELAWVEPFVTAKPQVLHFEIQSWADPATSRNYMFVCTSPKIRGETDETWKELRKIRRSFEVNGGVGK